MLLFRLMNAVHVMAYDLRGWLDFVHKYVKKINSSIFVNV